MEEIKEKLEMILNLLILLNRAEIKSIILEYLTENDELHLYQESDGIKSTRQLEEIAGISRSKVSSCWDKWTKIGIMKKNDQNRGIRLFDLDFLNINYND